MNHVTRRVAFLAQLSAIAVWAVADDPKPDPDRVPGTYVRKARKVRAVRFEGQEIPGFDRVRHNRPDAEGFTRYYLVVRKPGGGFVTAEEGDWIVTSGDPGPPVIDDATFRSDFKAD